MSNHIKIQGTSPRIQYVADGKLNAYEFPFVIFNPSDINVYFNDKVQDSDTYTVTMSKNIEGGEISFETAPVSGTIITIVRNLAIKRTTTFQEGGALRAKVLNKEFDYQMACQQQIADSLNRSMVLPPYAVDTDVDLTLPTPSAGKAIVWNSDGTNLENSTVEVNALESTLKGYKESAESSATVATEKASIASEKADIATEKANEAVSTLASKANKDMDNLSADGKGEIAYLSMPSNSYIDIPLGSSGSTYTAPANGYMFLTKTTGTGQSYNQACQLFVNGDGTRSGCIYMASMMTNPPQSTCSTWIPVKKNDVITYSYTASGALAHFRFVYAQGEI